MAIARESRESSSSRAINCNAYHQTGGVGRGGFGVWQLEESIYEKRRIDAETDLEEEDEKPINDSEIITETDEENEDYHHKGEKKQKKNNKR